jgi:transcriptional regulator with GAF, ATPase, and Fis domain
MNTVTPIELAEITSEHDSVTKDLIGTSLAIRRLKSSIARIAPSNLPVLITGETGTGKSVTARAIHDLSRRAAKPFVSVECSALPPTLIESALFGHEQGAFTGADRRYIGAFERANGGTIFLDELGELPLEIQPKLLGAIGRGEIVRVGGERPISVDVRVVAATNRDVEAMVDQGLFRRDLYFRVSSVILRLPPLRERPEDVPLIIDEFFERYYEELLANGAKGRRVGSEAMVELLAYNYPGNVRELINILRHAALFAKGDAIAPGDLPEQLACGRAPEGPPDTELRRIVEQESRPVGLREARDRLLECFERVYLKELMSRHGRRVSAAAREAGIGPRHMRRLLQKYRINR